MKDVDEAAVRLGLSLYRRTLSNGPQYFRIYDLVFDEPEVAPRSLFARIFSNTNDFWSLQDEAARVLDGSKLASVERRKIQGSVSGDVYLRLTDFGRKIYALAHIQSQSGPEDLYGLRIEDLAVVLREDDEVSRISVGIRGLDRELDQLGFSNFQRATIQSYTSVLIEICAMPERDVRLFWVVLDRLNQFAGVASLIVAIIALKVSH